MKIKAHPWTPQDLLDDLQDIIDEESDSYMNTRRTTLEMALAYLKEHFAEPKWVPTALGFFPEEYGRYLCVVRSFAFPDCLYQTILQYDNYGFREGNIYTDDVAYWMPLPNSPKEVAP
jgi:hypothetical protein